MTEPKLSPMVALFQPAHQPAPSPTRPKSEVLPAGALTPSEVMFRATKNVEHLNKNGALLVAGELFDDKVGRGGHLNFLLKDQRDQLRCVMFFQHLQRLQFKVEKGMRVLVTGKMAVKFSYVQLVVDAIEPLGIGAQELAFQQLKQRLTASGVFADDKKQALPLLPRRVGIVTSQHGAALHDVLKRLRERLPGVQVLLRCTKVQGDGAAAEIAEAIRLVDKAGCDVMLVVRGGGAADDLGAYNTEPVVQAIAHANTPVVCGVGHESDVTLADLAADKRASTPTHAAELAVPRLSDLMFQLARLRERMDAAVRAQQAHARLKLSRHKEVLSMAQQQLGAPRRRIETLKHRMHALVQRRLQLSRDQLSHTQLQLQRQHPAIKLEQQRARLSRLHHGLAAPVQRRVRDGHSAFQRLVAQMHALSPLAVLSRGYAVATDVAGRAIVDANSVSIGDAVRVRVHHGQFDAVVSKPKGT